jgi:transcriptional regulator with XRE-family HTH domain
MPSIIITPYRPRQIGLMARRMRRAAKMTQQDLGDLLKLTQSRISFIELGGSTSRGVTLGSLADFATGCGFTLHLVADPRPPTPKRRR